MTTTTAAMGRAMTTLKKAETHKDFAEAPVTPEDVFEAWKQDMDPEDYQDLVEMDILREYWEESFICLGEDLHYALMGEYPMGFPYDLQGAVEALGVGSQGATYDWALWEDMIRCGYVDPQVVEGATVAYYRHPMLDPGVPYAIADWHPHR